MIKVGVAVVDRTLKAYQTYERAARLGMDAAANVYEREVKRAHSDHYTTQQYRGTLGVKQSIRRDEPRKGRGGWSVEIGTKLKQPLYWEMGWQTKGKNSRTMRRRIWVPTLIAQTQAIRAAFARQVAQVMRNA